MPAFELDVEVQAVSRVLGQTPRQPQACGQVGSTAVDPGGLHPRIVTAREAHDKAPATCPDGLKVGHARIATVRQQQAIRQRGRVREELTFRVRIWRDLHRPDLVEKPAVGGMHLHRRGLNRRESPWERRAQRLLEGKR